MSTSKSCLPEQSCWVSATDSEADYSIPGGWIFPQHSYSHDNSCLSEDSKHVVEACHERVDKSIEIEAEFFRYIDGKPKRFLEELQIVCFGETIEDMSASERITIYMYAISHGAYDVFCEKGTIVPANGNCESIWEK